MGGNHPLRHRAARNRAALRRRRHRGGLRARIRMGRGADQAQDHAERLRSFCLIFPGTNHDNRI